MSEHQHDTPSAVPPGTMWRCGSCGVTLVAETAPDSTEITWVEQTEDDTNTEENQ